MNVEDGVAATNGLFQFWCTQSTGEGTFVVCMLAGREIIVDAGTAEWEGEFLFMAIGLEWMIEIGKWQDRTFGQTKVE